MAGSLTNDGNRSAVANAGNTLLIGGTGDPLKDGGRVQMMALIDPNTGLPFGSGGSGGGSPTSTNAVRGSAVVHRSAIAAADKLTVVGTITLTGTITGGSLSVSTTYYVSAAAFNKYGSSGAAAVVNTATGGSGTAMRCAFAQVAGADGYDIFLSTAVGAPLWVGRITEAQRASGIIISAVGTTTAGGAAGSVDVRLQGTQLACTVAPFTSNNAFTPDTVAGVGVVNCAGKSLAHIKTLLVVTDLRSLPSLNIVPFLLNGSDTFYDQAQLVTVPTLTTTGQALRQDYVIQVDGATGLVVLVDSIAGQGAACTVVVELS